MDHHTQIILISLAVNFFPWIVALCRGHNAKLAIFCTLIITDIFTVIAIPTMLIGIGFIMGGLLIIVWFSCLVWSLNGNTKRHDKRQAELIAQAMARQQISVT
jgi:hypothetical protein